MGHVPGHCDEHVHQFETFAIIVREKSFFFVFLNPKKTWSFTPFNHMSKQRKKYIYLNMQNFPCTIHWRWNSTIFDVWYLPAIIVVKSIVRENVFFFVFFWKSKKRDFLRFFALLHTFSRTMFAILQYVVKLVINPIIFSPVARQPALTWPAVCRPTQIVVRGLECYHPSMKRIRSPSTK